MKLGGVLTTMLVLAAPIAAGAQGHGGGGMAAGRGGVGQVAMAQGGASHSGAWHGGTGHGGMGHDGGFHGRGFDGVHGFHDHNGHFHDHGLLLGWPYWGWSGCGVYGDACDWGDESDPGAPSDDYGYTDAPRPPEAACGAWVHRGGRYVWAPTACGDPSAADPPAQAAVASNECSDWVWRADLHHSVCKRPSHAAG